MVHRSIIIAFVFALVAGACKKDNSTTGEPAQEAMGLYAKGFNALIGDPKQMITEYFDAIPEAGPDPASKPHLFPRQNFGASKIKEAREAFAKAKDAAPPALANLAPAATDAIAAIDKVSTIFTEAQKYYDAENYKDDKLARGRELHAQMLAAARQFQTAIDKLEDGLTVIEDQQAVAELAKHADKGYGYWFRFYNIEAKKFLGAVERASTAEQRAALATAFQPMATANDELAKFVASKGPGINGSFNAYVTQAGSFHATAVKLLRLVKEPTPDEQAIGREMETLVSNYNNLVSMANSLYQVEGANALN